MTDRPRDDDSENEGLGQEAGPDFAPPGAGLSGQPSPPQAPPQTSGSQRPTPQPLPSSAPDGRSAAGYAPPNPADRRTVQGFSEPPPRPKVPRGVITTVVTVLVVAVVITVAVVVTPLFAEPDRSLFPTSRPKSEPTDFRAPKNAEPQEQKGSGFTFTSPAGWARSPEWGDRNDGRIVDSNGNDISIWIFPKADARDRCRRELRSLEVWVPGEISELPDRKIGGKLAPGGQLLGEETYRMRCVLMKSAIYNITFESNNDDIDAVDQAFNAVLDSWKWN